MNTNCLQSVCVLILLICCLTSYGQSSYQVGTLPVVNVNMGFKKGWSLNAKWESRQTMISGSFSGESETKVAFVLSDVSLIGSKKVGLNNTLAGGYLIRIRGDKLIHRTIQQFTVVKRYNSIRLAHRFSTDQTFEAEELLELRARYRITAEIPFQGQTIDPKEWYLRANNEYLNSFQDTSYDLEIRVVPLLGYEFSDKHKLESGLDYRINSFLKGEARSNLWITINWFVNL